MLKMPHVTCLLHSAIVEGKVEVGQGSCDSLTEVTAYYQQLLEQESWLIDRCQVPCFLFEVVGPHLFVSGAVLANDALLLSELWLVPHG